MAGASDVIYAIPGWEGPFEEGVQWFATDDLSIHGGFDQELEVVLDGATPFPYISFGIVNSADSAVTIEPFSIGVHIYHADRLNSEPVHSFDIPIIEGTLPAHSRFSYSTPRWYGTSKNGEMLPDGKYVLHTHMPNQFEFHMEGDNMLIAHDVDYRWSGSKSFVIEAKWPRTFTAYSNCSIYVNGERYEIDEFYGQALLIEGWVYLPLRTIGEAVGAEVSWYSNRRCVHIEMHSPSTDYATAIPQFLDKNTLIATSIVAYSSFEIYINDTRLDLLDNEGYPLVINNRTYLPLRAVSNALKIPIHWDNETKSVCISGYL